MLVFIQSVPLFLPDFCENRVFRTDFFLKYHSNIKFHEKPLKRELSCSMKTDQQTNMARFVVAVHNSADVPHSILVNHVCFVLL